MRNEYARVGRWIAYLAAGAGLEILVVLIEETTGYQVGTLFRRFMGW